MFKLDLEKANKPEIKLPTSVGSSKKQENSGKTFISASLTMLKPWIVQITINCGKFFKRWGIPHGEYHTTFLALRNMYADQEATVKIGHGTMDWFQIGKGVYVKTIYCHSAYLTHIQNTSCEILGWMKRKLESRLPGEISITSDMQMTPLNGRKQRGTKESLDEYQRGK